MEDFAGRLRASGFRATPGRVTLLRALERSGRSLTVEEVGKKVPALNTATLYRALHELAAAGLLLRGSDGRVARFSYPTQSHHHHMICTDCGFVPTCVAC